MSETMGLVQQLRQKQTQRITPAMLMEFSLLQLPIADLRTTVKEEVDRNPALEIDPTRDFSMRSVGPSSQTRPIANGPETPDEHNETLDEHLMSELRMSGVEGRELAVCRAIVEELDRDGRFTGSYPDMIMVLGGLGFAGVTERELEAARQRVMFIDPKGCGARNLAECYRVQLDDVPRAQRAAVEKAIDTIASMLEAQDSSGHPPAKAQPPPEMPSPAILKILQRFQRFPGRLYDATKTQFVTPDIRVDAAGEVDVDQSDIPELRISPKYVEMAKDADLDEETRTYARERVRRAREFREAVIRRKETMETIAELMIARQQEFLERGPVGLKKLTMSELAREAKCTIATVSRAAARKYVKTPRGTFPMRKFFQLVDQEPVERLRQILASIPPGQIVSDEKVAALLAQAGYRMARRTINKYRHKLGFSTKSFSQN